MPHPQLALVTGKLGHCWTFVLGHWSLDIGAAVLCFKISLVLSVFIRVHPWLKNLKNTAWHAKRLKCHIRNCFGHWQIGSLFGHSCLVIGHSGCRTASLLQNLPSFIRVHPCPSVVKNLKNTTWHAKRLPVNQHHDHEQPFVVTRFDSE